MPEQMVRQEDLAKRRWRGLGYARRGSLMPGNPHPLCGVDSEVRLKVTLKEIRTDECPTRAGIPDVLSCFALGLE